MCTHIAAPVEDGTDTVFRKAVFTTQTAGKYPEGNLADYDLLSEFKTEFVSFIIHTLHCLCKHI